MVAFMSNSGAQAALKGYRLQTLYILNQILLSNDPSLIFQPEGNEDLAIYNENNLIKSIQIKALSRPLTLSDFINHNQKDSFIHRSLILLNYKSKPKVEIISFGEIGQELNNAWRDSCKDKNKIRHKLKNFQINDNQIDLLFNRLKLNKVSEEKLHQEIITYLNNNLTSGSPEHALSILTTWLYKASEQRTKINKKCLLNNIYSIGKYLSEREAHHKEWYKSIIPLNNSISTKTEKLEHEYYKGISTRFSHIQANLDVIRQDPLSKIEKYFKKSQTVIIHGASGQGKTALAYRYLIEYIPEVCRFQISFIENKKHAQTIALAIADYLATFKSELYLYLDITPNDKEWDTLVKALLEKENIKILISIREEDLVRKNISNEQLGFPELLRLSFNKEEAKLLFKNFRKKDIVTIYPSFEQAWLGFTIGNSGSLLEFVFYLTQTTSLKQRLESQVKRLRMDIRKGNLEKEALTLLLTSVIATSYETKLNLKSLISTIKLNDPKGTFELFENEYLIRRSTDNLYIEALHPIRSKILTEILIDPAFSPWIDSVSLVLQSISEDSIEAFLLHSFIDKPEEFHNLFSLVKKLKLTSWTAIAGINRALLWYGISQHALYNMPTINRAKSKYGADGWPFIFSLNLDGATQLGPIENFIQIMAKNNEEEIKNIKQLRNEISNLKDIYQYAIKWLIEISYESIKHPPKDQEWSDLGEILLWIGRLNITPKLNLEWIFEIDINNNFKKIEYLAEFTNGLFHINKQLYSSFITKNKEAMNSLFQNQTHTIFLDEKNDCFFIHYILPKKDIDEIGIVNETLNKTSIDNIYLLNKLYPHKEKYGAQGYGHQYLLKAFSIHDDSYKNIPTKNIYAPQFIKMNSIWIDYANYNLRPNNWAEYANNLLSIREQINNALAQLNKALIFYFKNNKAISLFDSNFIDGEKWCSLARISGNLPLLPKQTVDPWGMTSERTDSKSQSKNGNTANYLSMQNDSKNFRKSLNTYVTNISNFFQQSTSIIATNSFLGRSPKEHHYKIHQLIESKGLSIKNNTPHLSCSNLHNAKTNLNQFQLEFSSLFKELINPEALKKIEIMENKQLKSIWSLWYQFTYSPERHSLKFPDKLAVSHIENIKKHLIRDIEYFLKKTRIEIPVIDNNYNYHDTRALYIEINIENRDIELTFKIILEALSLALQPLNYKDLKFFSLTELWDNILIIPLIDGINKLNLAWVLTIGSFTNNTCHLQSEEFLRPYQSNNYFNEKITEDNDIEKLKKEISLISSILNHLHCFNPILENIKDTGAEILKTYFESFQDSLGKHIDTSIYLIQRIRDHFNSDKKLIEILDICIKALLYNHIKNTQQIKFDIKENEDWIEHLNNALLELSLYK